MSMEDIALRFAVLQRRFVLFSEQAHPLLRDWLSKQLVNSLEISLDRLTESLFAAMMCPPSDVPQLWLKTIARCALEDQLSCVPHARYGRGGASVVFPDISSTLCAVWPGYSRTCIATRPHGGGVGDGEPVSSSLRERNAILEVTVRDLEAKILALERFPLGRQQPDPMRKPLTMCPSSVSMPATSIHTFLMEKRFEVEDAIATFRRVQDEFNERKRVLEMLSSDQTQRWTERRRAEQKRARRELALATDEITRLRAEVQRLESMEKGRKGAGSASTVQLDAAADPIVPRRALKIAGFWDVSHNDVLLITPHLVRKFESVAGEGAAIRHKNMQVCFPAKDQKLLVDVVVEVMAEHLPRYARTG